MSQASPTFMRNKQMREEDQRARDEATRIFEGPFLLEAGAGTGKTATLVARVVSWAVGPGWERAELELSGSSSTADLSPNRIAGRVLDGIVAITFTDAAAAEMSERVELGLAKVQLGEPLLGLPVDVVDSTSAVVQERAALLRAAIERLTVCTIHSFCRRLLAENPLELGIDPAFQVDADGAITAEILREAIEARLREAFTRKDPDPDHALLASRGKGPLELEQALEKLLEGGVLPDALADSPWTSEAITQLSHSLKALFHEWSEVHSVPLGNLPGNAKTELKLRNAFNEELAYLVDEFEGTTPEELSAFQERFLATVTEEGTWKKIGEWKKGVWSKSLQKVMTEDSDRDAFAAWATQLHEKIAVLKTFDHELFEASRRVLALLLGDVKRALRNRGTLTFTDLLTNAEVLLREHADVRRRVLAGLDQLLVDEFQDTDPLQCSIIRSLMQEDSVGGDKAPGLFLVGDPKQSIYGFRRADLGAYDAFKSEITHDSDHVYRLDVNHRSYPWILDEVQRCVEPAMEREEGIQPEFQPLLPSPKRETVEETERFGDRTAGAPRGVEHWLVWDRAADENDLPAHLNSPEAADLEAHLVAADLRRLKNEGKLKKWNDVGLLFRTLGHVEPLLFALRDQGIPYDVSGDKSYYKRREILDASSIVRAVLDPSDHLALIAALRSSFAGVPDAAWAPLWAQEFPARMSELRELDEAKLAALDKILDEASKAIPEELDEDALVAGWTDAARLAIRAIASLRFDFQRLPADRFVESLRSATAFEVTEAARYLGSYRVANLEIFYTELTDALERGAGDSHSVLRNLRRKMAAGENAAEGRPQESERDAVRIFTVHKSKGLQFPHVYLLQAQRKPQSNARPTLDVAPAGDAHFEFMLFGAASPGWNAAYDRRLRREAAERVRNLYVALTRAEDRLVISGNWPVERPTKSRSSGKPKRQPKSWSDSRSFCDLLLSRDGGIGDPEASFTQRILEERGESKLSEEPLSFDVPGASVSIPSFGLDAKFAEAQGQPPIENPVARPNAVELAQQGRDLKDRRVEAHALQEKPFYDSPSAELSDRPLDPRDSSVAAGASEGDRALARRAGTEVHRLLERLDLESGDVLAALDAERALSLESPECLAAVDEILSGLTQSTLLERLAGEASGVVARELACLVTPEDGDRARGVIAGSIDLVLRDSVSGEFTIVDYKTDRALEQDREALADHYAPQLALYARAFQRAFKLEKAPACEVWFLRSGVALPVEVHERMESSPSS